MTKKERNEWIKWANTLTDEELVKETYKAMKDCCGSLYDRMYDLGYDLQDISERADFEKFSGEKYDLLEDLCIQRGIKLWEPKQ